MRKFYLIFLLCFGASLTMLSAYLSAFFEGYVNSIFYAVSMILLSSIMLIMFLESKDSAFPNKLLLLSCSFVVLFYSSVIVQNVFVFTEFGTELVSMLSIFFLMAATALMLLTTVALRDESSLNNTYSIILIFLPLIFFAGWVLLNNPLVSDVAAMQIIPLRLFILLYVNAYSILIAYNLVSEVSKVLTIKAKFILVAAGLVLILVSSAFRVAGIFTEFTGILSLIGVFSICFGLLMDSGFTLYSVIFSGLLNNLYGSQKANFAKYLKSAFNKRKGLVVSIEKGAVSVKDNWRLDNFVEKKEYEKVLVGCIRWYRRHVRHSASFIKDLKHFYNNQVVLTKRLNSFLA